MLYGHRNDVEGYARALEEVDAWLPALEAKLGDGRSGDSDGGSWVRSDDAFDRSQPRVCAGADLRQAGSRRCGAGVAKLAIGPGANRSREFRDEDRERRELSGEDLRLTVTARRNQVNRTRAMDLGAGARSVRSGRVLLFSPGINEVASGLYAGWVCFIRCVRPNLHGGSREQVRCVRGMRHPARPARVRINDNPDKLLKVIQ